jgi:uncharacterized membrane protein YfhO
VVTGGQQPVFLDDAAALRSLFDPAFDSRSVVVLPEAARQAVKATNRVPVQVSELDFRANRVTMRVTAPAPAMLVVAQAYDHPWRAYVDGEPVSLWRANYAFQALQVPAGGHRVQLVYQDRLFEAGCGISLATLFGCIAAWAWQNRNTPAGNDIRPLNHVS